LTLVETIVAVALFSLVLAGAYGIFFICLNKWHMSRLYMRVSYENSYIIERIVYGAEGSGGLREADSAGLVTTTNGWVLFYDDADDFTHSYQYNQPPGTIVYTPGPLLVCSNVAYASVVTNPAGNGLSVRVDIGITEGRHTWSNSMSTFVQFRNRQGG